MKKSDILAFFEILRRINPEPKTELRYTNPYTLLIAVVLSAQSTDAGVNKATEKLFQIIQHPRDILEMGEGTLKEHIKSIGLYHTKARNIIALSRILVDQFSGKVPTTREALESLPGVGRKTANVVLNVAYNAETFAVDTHIFRVCNRTGLAPGKNPLEVEQKLEKRVPRGFRSQAHHWLILHGRYICKARKPLCFRCPVVHTCAFPDKNL